MCNIWCLATNQKSIRICNRDIEGLGSKRLFAARVYLLSALNWSLLTPETKFFFLQLSQDFTRTGMASPATA